MYHIRGVFTKITEKNFLFLSSVQQSSNKNSYLQLITLQNEPKVDYKKRMEVCTAQKVIFFQIFQIFVFSNIIIYLY